MQKFSTLSPQPTSKIKFAQKSRVPNFMNTEILINFDLKLMLKKLSKNF